MNDSPMTVLAMPKPFHGHIGIIQRNAIRSWTKLKPRPQIFLFGEEAGTAEVAAELQIGHLRDIQRSDLGTPLLSDLLTRAREATKTPLLVYVNSDIILLQEFQDAVSVVQRKFSQFLGVAQRWEIDLRSEIDFANDRQLQVEQLPPGHPGHHTAIDVFVFTRDMYDQVPPLVLGRAWFDQWLIKDALLHGISVVDVTKVARAIHQQHDYSHIAGGQSGAYAGEEARRNLEIYGGVQHAFTLLHATHELLSNGIIRRTRYRAGTFRVRQWLWRAFVQRTAPLRKRLGLGRARQ